MWWTKAPDGCTQSGRYGWELRWKFIIVCQNMNHAGWRRHVSHRVLVVSSTNFNLSTSQLSPTIGVKVCSHLMDLYDLETHACQESLWRISARKSPRRPVKMITTKGLRCTSVHKGNSAALSEHENWIKKRLILLEILKHCEFSKVEQAVEATVTAPACLF